MRQLEPSQSVPHRSDEEIVAQVLSGDVASFELLVRRHNQKLYRTVRSILRDDTETEDVMQHAHVAAFENLRQFRGGSQYSTWLVRIAIHEAKARLRKKGRFAELDEDAVDGPMGGWSMAKMNDPERAAGSRQLGEVLESVIAELPAHHRAVFVLREIEGMSTFEVAESLEVSEDNVKTRLHRAKAALRDRITERLGEATGEVWRFYAPRCNRVWAGVFETITSLQDRG